MILWVDAQLSPQIAPWLAREFGVTARAVRDVGLRDAKDREIFLAARQANATIVTKDSDFLQLLSQLGTPPQIVWITCRNTSNDQLRTILNRAMPHAIEMLGMGEPIVEISDSD